MRRWRGMSPVTRRKVEDALPRMHYPPMSSNIFHLFFKFFLFIYHTYHCGRFSDTALLKGVARTSPGAPPRYAVPALPPHTMMSGSTRRYPYPPGLSVMLIVWAAPIWGTCRVTVYTPASIGEDGCHFNGCYMSCSRTTDSIPTYTHTDIRIYTQTCSAPN